MRWVLAAALLAVPSLSAGATLVFLRDGAVVRRLDTAALERACGVTTVEVTDPYYETAKRYRGCPLAAVVEAGFGAPAARLDADDVVFHALDGYAKPATVARLGEAGG